VTSASLPGADFLSRGFSFSPLVYANASETNIYVFGGMCPTYAATSSTWQSAASYSNHMLRLAPTISSSSRTTYTLDLTSSRGPPIAEAGFTITGLVPTYSNASGIMTQQQTFVLLGGHTQNAFINMSQVAIWSLPEESWSFVTVDSPSSSSNANTELAIKSTVTSIDSRSGHSAVLTEDGSKVIVYGGWVGDINQAADPQLAVLSLGTGFGGSGDWQWSVPAQQPSGTGMYGHGAVMLPGNIMMVLGGFNISSSGTSKRATTVGTQALFYNATSMTWVSNYTNPAYVAAIASQAATASSSAHSKSSSLKVGLGLGIPLGLAAIIGAVVFYCWYSRRLRHRRQEAREKDLGNLSIGGANFYQSPTREMGQRSGGFPWTNNRWNGGLGEQESAVYHSNSAIAGYENLQSGIHGIGDGDSIPIPPKQITRKPLNARNARGSYQPAPTTFDFNNGGSHGRANSLGTAGPIHPIYEADEDDNSHPGGVGIAIGEPSSSRANRYSDPFKDPPPANSSVPTRRETHRSVSTNDAESPARSREREIQEWVSDWAAADALMNAQARSHSNAGRLSPTRRAQLIAASTVSSVSGEEDSGRTASNLSERSVAVSVLSVSRSGSSSHGRSRSNSLRGFISGMNPFASTVVSATVPSTTLSPVFDGPRPHGPRNYVPPRSAGSGSSSSFNTARTSFPALQAEGESLLPRPDDEMSTGHNSPNRSTPDLLNIGSPSKSKPSALGKGRVGWLGSLRKAFIRGSEGSPLANPDTLTYSSREGSPIRIDNQVEPRRTVSAGAMLWRRKQGKSDWEDSAGPSTPTGRSNTFTGNLSTPVFKDAGGETDGEDDEWDIERAVENRVVQVMFTVPKEKLRVVNQDVDEERSEVGSLKSGKGSKRSLKDVAAEEPLLEKVDEGDNEPLTEVERRGSPSPSQKGKGKEKGKVLEMVEKMEGRSSPEHH
jgi:hypothetical protein